MLLQVHKVFSHRPDSKETLQSADKWLSEVTLGCMESNLMRCGLEKPVQIWFPHPTMTFLMRKCAAERWLVFGLGAKGTGDPCSPRTSETSRTASSNKTQKVGWLKLFQKKQLPQRFFGNWDETLLKGKCQETIREAKLSFQNPFWSFLLWFWEEFICREAASLDPAASTLIIMICHDCGYWD